MSQVSSVGEVRARNQLSNARSVLAALVEILATGVSSGEELPLGFRRSVLEFLDHALCGAVFEISGYMRRQDSMRSMTSCQVAFEAMERAFPDDVRLKSIPECYLALEEFLLEIGSFLMGLRGPQCLLPSGLKVARRTRLFFSSLIQIGEAQEVIFDDEDE